MLNQFILPSIVFPLLERSSSTRFWSLYQELETLQAADLQAKTDNQHGKLAHLLRTAGESTPHWRELFAGLGVAPADIDQHNALPLLQQLPVTNKQTYSNGFPDRVTAQPNDSSWQYLSSAGTTGRMTVVTDFDKRDYLRAAEHLNLKLAISRPLGIPTADIPPSACNVVCGFADSGPEPLAKCLWWATRQGKLFDDSTMSDIRGRFERQVILQRQTLAPIDGASWPEMCVQLDEYLDLIVSEKIQLLRALPHFLLWLAKRARQRGLRCPSLRALIPYGGLAGDVMAQQVSEIFEAPFINVYGTGEVGAIGCASESSDTIDIYQSMVLMESLDDEGRPVPEGEVGNVVITDLNNLAMPIIRYAIGDIGRLNVSGVQQRLHLLGRKQESFTNNAGELVHARALQNLFFSYPAVLNFKLEQVTSQTFKASVVIDPDAGDEDFDQDGLAQALQDMLASKQKPAIKRTAFIQPETSGKYLSLKPRAS